MQHYVGLAVSVSGGAQMNGCGCLARHHLECGAHRIQWRVEIWWRLARGPRFGLASLGLAQCDRRALAAVQRARGRHLSNVQIEALLGYQFTNGISWHT
jgi:hypothetical protein